MYPPATLILLQAVVGGKSGIADMETLVLITDELLHGKSITHCFFPQSSSHWCCCCCCSRKFASTAHAHSVLPFEAKMWNLLSDPGGFSSLFLLRPGLFLPAEERMAKEAAATAAREAAEASLGATEEEREAAMLEELKALDEKYAAKATAGTAGADDDAKLKAAASKAAADKAAVEIAEAIAEENRVKEEAAKLEELMRQLDMSSDEEDD
jgi:hypothetical protein